MTASAADLRAAITEATPRLLALDDATSAARPSKDSWCAREIIGHLIDSAANNHPRFIRGQIEGHLDFDGYAQEEWVAVQQYNALDWNELVSLWRLYNLHLANVMDAAPESSRLHQHARHSLERIAWKPVPAMETATLDYLMSDYVEHLRHHLAQIFSLPGVAAGADD